MPETNITGWLDPAIRQLARTSGIPEQEYAAIVGGEGIATSLEVLADFFTKGWLNRLIQAGSGALSLGYAIWGQNVPTRLRQELLVLGTHEGLRVMDNPLGWQSDAQSFLAFVQALMRGDWNAALASALRTPAELGVRMGAGATLVDQATQAANVIKATTTPSTRGVTPATPLSPATGTRYTVRPESLPLGTAAPGRYMVTG